MPAWLVVPIAAGVITYLVFYLVREVRRSAAMDEAARALGLAYETKGDYSFFTGLRDTRLYAQGDSRTARNVLRGSAGPNDGISLTIGDYHYREGSSMTGRRARIQTVLRLSADALALPSFHLRPKTRLSALGGRDEGGIDFPDHPEFSQHYFLESEPAGAVCALFGPEVLDFFAARPGLSIEGDGKRLILYRKNKLAAPEEVGAMVEDGVRLLGLLRP